MSTAIENDLDRHSKETGIAKPELKQMCLRAGLDQIRRGELQVRALRPDQRSLALVLPRETYAGLQRLASASGEAVEGFCVLLLTEAAGSVEPSAGDDRLPVFLPARDVHLLRNLCDAAGVEGGLESLLGGVVGTIASDSLMSTERSPSGALDLLLDGWEFDDPAATKTAMLAVVDRWKAKDTAA